MSALHDCNGKCFDACQKLITHSANYQSQISNKLTCENRLTLIFSYFDAVQIRKSCHAEDSGFSAMFSVAHTQKVTFSASHNTYLVTAFDGV